MKKIFFFLSFLLSLLLTTINSHGQVAHAGGTYTVDRLSMFTQLDGTSSTGVTTYQWTAIAPFPNQPTNMKVEYSNVGKPYIKILITGTWKFELSINGGVSKDTATVVVTWNSPPPQSTGFHVATASDTTSINATDGIGYCSIGDYIITGANDLNIGTPGNKNVNIFDSGLSRVQFTPGKKILINASGAEYGTIQLIFSATQCQSFAANRTIIAGYGGNNLRCNLFALTNGKSVWLDGEYAATKKTVSYNGFAGGYAYRAGHFGIQMNDHWLNLGAGCLGISGQFTDSVKVSGCELGNGGFAGIFMKEHNIDSNHVHTIFRGIEITLNYIHDTHGEANYIGDTGSDCWFVNTVGTLAGGSGYTNGTYLNVALNGGSGSGTTANITVAGGVVTSVVLQNLQNGCGYKRTDVGATLTCPNTSIGGTGSGFSVHIATQDWVGQHNIINLNYHENVICRAGNELVQAGDESGLLLQHNAGWLGSINNWSPFDELQDQSVQLDLRNGGARIQFNLWMGAGRYTQQSFIQSKEKFNGGGTFNGDSILYSNNVQLGGGGDIGGFLKLDDSTAAERFIYKNNYAGYWVFRDNNIYLDSRGTNKQTILQGLDNWTINHLSFRNNISDNSKTAQFTNIAVGVEMDSSGNTKATVAFPQFANTGFAEKGYADSTVMRILKRGNGIVYGEWGDEYPNKRVCCGVRQGDTIIYNSGDLVTFLGRIYKSRINNNKLNMPFPTDVTNWQLLTWTDPQSNVVEFPPDDVRLLATDPYAIQGIGLSATFTPSVPSVNNGQLIIPNGNIIQLLRVN